MGPPGYESLRIYMWIKLPDETLINLYTVTRILKAGENHIRFEIPNYDDSMGVYYTEQERDKEFQRIERMLLRERPNNEL